MLIKHLLEVAALIFFAICLGGVIYWCGFRHKEIRWLHRDPFRDEWWHQQRDETGPLEGVVVVPQVPRPVVHAPVRDFLEKADTDWKMFLASWDEEHPEAVSHEITA